MSAYQTSRVLNWIADADATPKWVTPDRRRSRRISSVRIFVLGFPIAVVSAGPLMGSGNGAGFTSLVFDLTVFGSGAVGLTLVGQWFIPAQPSASEAFELTLF